MHPHHVCASCLGDEIERKVISGYLHYYKSSDISISYLPWLAVNVQWETPIPTEKVRNRNSRTSMTSESKKRSQGNNSTKNGKNGAVLLAEELQVAQAKRRMAHGLCRQKEESSQRRVLRAFQELHGKR